MKKLYSLWLSLLFVAFAIQVQGQDNIAPDATLSTNVFSNATYPPERTNDNIITTCPGNECWFPVSNTTTGEYLEWEWKSTVFTNKIVIHHGETGNRFLDGADFEYWDGSKWVQFYSFSNLNMNNCESTHTFNAIGSNRIRMVNWSIVGRQNNNPDFREIQIFEVDTDLELLEVNLSSYNFCSGNPIPLDIKVRNNGPGEAQQIRFQYGLENGPMQTSTFVFPLPANEDTVLSLDPFISNANGNNLKLVVSNAVTDVDPSNDTKDTFVNILRSPSGSVLLKYPGANFIYNTGDLGDPDVSKEKDTLIYEFTPPFGYVNSGYGTTWSVNPQPIAEKGYPIPTSFYSTTPPQGGNNGFITLIVPTGLADSTINMNIKLNSAANGCDSTINRLTYVAPTPKPDFIFENTCVGSPTIFTNQSSIEKGLMFFLWDFGDGVTTDQQEPIHTYNNPGTYPVKLTVTSDWGVQKDTVIMVTIGEQPDAKFSQVNSCEGVALTFTNNSTINNGTMTFQWNVGDGTSYTQKDITHLYAQPGVYIVSLTATSGEGCVGKSVRQAVQFARPTADFMVTGANTCGNDPVHFENTSTIEMNEKTGAVWTFGDGTGLTRSNVAIHKYATPGIRTVKMVAYSQFGCLDSIEKQVEVIAGPEVEFEWDRNCSESPVVFTNNTNEQGANTIYEWKFGDGNTSTDKSPSYTYGTLGKRTVTLYAEADNGCKQEIAKTIVILPEPKIDFEVDDVCAGEFTQFRNHSDVEFGELDYTWEFGDGNSSNEGSPFYRYSQQGGATYDVTLKGQQPGSCEGSITKSVQVFEKPECGFTYSISDEDRTKVTLTPNNPNYAQYQWVVEGSGLQSTDANPEFDLPFAEKLYTVKLRITTSDGCECNEQAEVRSSWEVGVDQLNKVAIQVYPNPTNGKVYVQMDASEFVSVELVDLTGKRLLQSTDQKLDLSAFTNGIYILRVSTVNNGVQNVKVKLNK